MDQRETLLEEIKQITSQYRNEVPGKRRAWPKAIKDRVMQLSQLGVAAKYIAIDTGLPYFTVLKWKRDSRRAGEFREIAIKLPAIPEVAMVTMAKSKLATKLPKAATVTVTTPAGLKIEGLSFDQILTIMGRQL